MPRKGFVLGVAAFVVVLVAVVYWPGRWPGGGSAERREVITRHRAGQPTDSSFVRFQISFAGKDPISAEFEVVESGRERGRISIRPARSWTEGRNLAWFHSTMISIADSVSSVIKNTENFWAPIFEEGHMTTSKRYVWFNLGRRIVVFQLRGKLFVWPHLVLSDWSEKYLRRVVRGRSLSEISCWFETGLERDTGRAAWDVSSADWECAYRRFRVYPKRPWRFKGAPSSSFHMVRSPEELDAVLRKWGGGSILFFAKSQEALNAGICMCSEEIPGLMEPVPWLRGRICRDTDKRSGPPTQTRDAKSG